MKARAEGKGDPTKFEVAVRTAVNECVRRQAESGIDIVTDGEQSKTSFLGYVGGRIAGMEPRPGKGSSKFKQELAAFPEYYEQYFKVAMAGSTIVPFVPMVCVAPLSYVGQDELVRDIANLKAIVGKVPHAAVFMPALAPSGIGANEYYGSEEEFLYASGEALRTEYNAIVEAGFLLQIDDPFIPDIFAEDHPAEQIERRAHVYVDALNHSLRGIPPARIRYHTCYSINEGPRVHDVPFAKFVNHMLRVNAGAYSFEAGNVRHEHEYHLWETVKLPDGKVLMPGLIAHASNIVEHPELIAERLMRFADRVGRENVIASVDCGFSSQAAYKTEVHPTVIWAKFEALRDGARLASERLWP
jgi:5-methyltetrahydropteroyltriglutamate--homocysteine methyltransferase